MSFLNILELQILHQDAPQLVVHELTYHANEETNIRPNVRSKRESSHKPFISFFVNQNTSFFDA